MEGGVSSGLLGGELNVSLDVLVSWSVPCTGSMDFSSSLGALSCTSRAAAVLALHSAPLLSLDCRTTSSELADRRVVGLLSGGAGAFREVLRTRAVGAETKGEHGGVSNAEEAGVVWRGLDSALDESSSNGDDAVFFGEMEAVVRDSFLAGGIGGFLRFIVRYHSH